MQAFRLLVTIFFLATIGLGIALSAFAQPKPITQPKARAQWNVTHESTPQKLSPEQLREIERLNSLGYVGGETVVAENMVTVYNEQASFNGLNLYLSAYASAANLIDMRGNVLHQWTYDKATHGAGLVNASDGQEWHMAHVYPNGDIIFLQHLQGLLKLDKDSKLIWARSPGLVHHDMDVREDGAIFVLTRRATVMPEISRNTPIMNDSITHLDKDGQIVRIVSILDCLKNAREHELLAEIRRNVKRDRGDILHTNSIEMLDGSISARVSEFQKGRLLISCRSIDSILVIDLDQEKVVWKMKGKFKYQHSPSVLENGNLLIFDNNRRSGKSAVREIDPANGMEHWVYTGTEENPFFCYQNGRSKRLPNGNTLIVESTFGRIFEVTPDKEIVWEFWNPVRAGENGEYIGRVYECLRYPVEYFGDWLNAKPLGDSSRTRNLDRSGDANYNPVTGPLRSSL